MNLKELIASYTRYNHWANETMIQWLKTLESGMLYKETPSSFGSIDLTVQHMNNAQNFWLAMITEAGVEKLDETIKVNAADTTMHNLLEGSRQMLSTFTAYTEEGLLKQIPSSDMVQCRYAFMLHVINHNSYHRGQIVTMSRCLGVINDIPTMDYEVFLWGSRQ